MPAVLNAANEAAVESFLAGKIEFLQIGESVMETVSALMRHRTDTTLDAILAADKEARSYTCEWIAHHGKRSD